MAIGFLMWIVPAAVAEPGESVAGGQPSNGRAADEEAELRAKAQSEPASGPTWQGTEAQRYWAYLASKGKLQDHVKKLAEKIKHTPGDVDRVFEYIAGRFHLPQEQRPPILWLAETCRLKRALHNCALGQMFQWESPEAAIHFYERSLACPVTDYDRQHFSEFNKTSQPIFQVEKFLRHWAKVDLVRACLKAKKVNRAQKLVEELTDKKDGSDTNAMFFLAGQVEAASGQRLVEGRVKKAEKENTVSIIYWLNRAEYFKGRGALDQAEHAYQVAVKLPVNTWHTEAVLYFGRFLADQKRIREAEQVYRDEMARLDPADLQALNFWLMEIRSLKGK